MFRGSRMILHAHRKKYFSKKDVCLFFFLLTPPTPALSKGHNFSVFFPDPFPNDQFWYKTRRHKIDYLSTIDGLPPSLVSTSSGSSTAVFLLDPLLLVPVLSRLNDFILIVGVLCPLDMQGRRYLRASCIFNLN